MQVINWPLDKAGDAVLNTPGVGWVIEKSIGGLVNATNDAAQWSVRPEAIYEEYRKAGQEGVHAAGDLVSLDLERVDHAIGRLGAKYKGVALTEGAAFGAMGLPGIPADIVALVLLNLRAIGEYATYCGFDVSLHHEGLYAMHMLGLASSPSDAAKALAMADLVKLAKDVAAKKTFADLQKSASLQLMQKSAKALGFRLTKAKIAQFIPYAGALVGGGFNIYFTAKVCDAAYFLYRERFLAAKYGNDYVRDVPGPPSDHEPHYPEADEEIPHDRTPPEPPSA
jgi:EcsC protein family